MYKNYIKIAWRNLVRRNGHAFINIGGLAVGIAVCILIFSIVQFELSFDNYHTKKDQIYRVLTEFRSETEPEPSTNSGVPFALPRELKAAIPQIDGVAAIFGAYDVQIQVPDENGNTRKKFKEETGIFFTEPSLFDILDFNWLVGHAASLEKPNNVVLDKETADKYFGSWENAMGIILR